MLSGILFILITVAASVIHGSDYVKKGILVPAHALLVWALCGLLYVPFIFVWWYFFRRSWHARAEIDYITGVSGIDKVIDAYGMPIGLLAAEIVRYCKDHRWHWLSERRQQELLLALLLTAPVCAIPPALMGLFV